jgi:hypothetical protein
MLRQYTTLWACLVLQNNSILSDMIEWTQPHLNVERFVTFTVIQTLITRKSNDLPQVNWKRCLATRDVPFVHHGWHGTHRYDIQVTATHASSWVHRYYSLLQWSVPRALTDLTARIIAAAKNVDAPTMTREWHLLEYRIDVCRVTRGVYIEHL